MAVSSPVDDIQKSKINYFLYVVSYDLYILHCLNMIYTEEGLLYRGGLIVDE